MSATGTPDTTTPLSARWSALFRVWTMPALTVIVLLVVRGTADLNTWMARFLGVGFLLYYGLVCVYGVIVTRAIAEHLFRHMSGKDRAGAVERALQYLYSSWIAGAILLAMGYYVAMAKRPGDMPIPFPYVQVFASMFFVGASSLALVCFNLHRKLAYLQDRSASTFVLKSVLVYGALSLFFPLYFFVYAGHGKNVTIPFLIVLTLPLGIVMTYLVRRYVRRLQILVEGESAAALLFRPEYAQALKRLVAGFVLLVLAVGLVGFDYSGRSERMWVWAARRGSTFWFSTFAPVGARARATDRHAFTPLHWAAFENRPRFAGTMIRRGADLNARNEFGQTPLLIAALMNRKQIVSLLLEKGADVNRTEQHGQTPLMLAARGGHMAVLGMLLKKQARVNAVSQRKNTALGFAVARGHVKIAETLIKAGANVRVKHYEFAAAGESLVALARRRGDAAMLGLLAKHGVR